MEAPQKDVIKCNVQRTRCNKCQKKDNKKALRFEYDLKQTNIGAWYVEVDLCVQNCMIVFLRITKNNF